ncbi:hypothetical protein SAMN04488515_0177 [Cognatiyoonia koreensis]|uniref:Capsule polysaccharide biosynthesis protein n=1 Tax=Cognatiyoonia koreensis TaxID=364200 RepID=A0A1I0MRU5_9RHOB|nr:hypothetical protein [Cognatiyoonia koreensis]SEV90891.1 hypothetical protein SAMN04488515_0177 [Cognatiyoonia koreensis]
MTRTVDFYLRPRTIRQLTDGTGHRFYSRAMTAFESIGLQVNLIDDSNDIRKESLFAPCFALFDHKVPIHDLSLDVRRTAIGPFYRMEKSPIRAKYRLVDRPFCPADIPAQKAQSFFRIWQKLIVKPKTTEASGVVLVALQGQLLARRSQQAVSPVDMIRATMAHEKDRQIWLKLHPKESYSVDELAAIAQFASDPRVTVFDGDLDTALHACDYIVTQNSSVVLRGLFYQRPAIVFADCEFHHPFKSVRRGVPVAAAFDTVMTDQPDFAAFAYWYLQLNCINTSREWVEEMILTQCREFGWDI